MSSTLHQRAAVPTPPESPTQLSTARLGPVRRNLERRVARLEQSNRYLGFALVGCVGLVLAMGVALLKGVAPAPVNDVESTAAVAGTQEIKLTDAAGRPRFLVRMYSGVPVMQLIDEHGQSRLAFGLKLDDAPFVDLSDSSGNTRASLSLGEDNAAVLRMFDALGNPTFAIN